MQSKITAITLFALAIVFIMAGCQTSQPLSQDAITNKTNYVTVTNYINVVVTETNSISVTNIVLQPPPPEDVKDHYGLSFRDAQDKAVRLQMGMSQDAVKSLLGNPDETGSGEGGTQMNPPQPWVYIEWNYRWRVSYNGDPVSMSSHPIIPSISASEGLNGNTPQIYAIKQLQVTFAQGKEGSWLVASWQWQWQPN
ncbi:MAG TPA: hypothetical protein VH280_15005 [Verrucomicrobiae bacterium]|jgi:outer membrane protein assembly factor BamE (lipoprotein component of BamABCDE complex)|nr:hypothetical protein [Verrucomicrobiae bacterium]